MGWLAIVFVVGAFLFGVLVGVLAIGLCQIAETCWRHLTQQPHTAIHHHPLAMLKPD